MLAIEVKKLHEGGLLVSFRIRGHKLAISVRTPSSSIITDLHPLPDELGELPLDHAAAAQVRVLEHAPVEALVHAVHHGHRLAHHLRVAGLQDLQQRILYLVLIET